MNNLCLRSRQTLPSQEISDWELHKDHMPSLGSRSCTNVVPSDLSTIPKRNKLPWGIPVQFKKEEDDFLSGPLLVKDGKVKIESPYALGPGLIPVKVNKCITHSEKLCRTGLKDFSLWNLC